jgi:hypothetical protein
MNITNLKDLKKTDTKTFSVTETKKSIREKTVGKNIEKILKSCPNLLLF